MGRFLLILVAGALALSGCAAAGSSVMEESEGQESASEGDQTTAASVLELEIGTCVNDANIPLRADLTDVPVVACTQPHDSELYAIVSVDDGAYPGADLLIEQGQSKCQASFADFVGIDFRSSLLDFHFYYPTPSSWAQGDRTIYCMVFDPGLKIAGTLQDAKR
jgi:hypothetical protein